MPADDLELDRANVAGAAKRVNVGARDEAGFLGGADNEAGGPLAFKFGQHLVEFFDQVSRQRIGAGAFAVEQQPGDAIGITGEFEVFVRPAGVRLRPEFEHAVAENVHDL